MKPTYSGFSAKENKGFLDVPPVGAYCAEIQSARYIPANDSTNKLGRDFIELYIDITDGEYKGRYMELWKDQREKFGNAAYKGIFRLIPPTDGDEPWRKSNFEGALWCVEQSNPDYHWDWEEEKLKGKKVGINIRKRLYSYNGKDKETTEIGELKTIDDVKNGKCRRLNDRDTRKNSDGSGDEQNFTDVSAKVDVPW